METSNVDKNLIRARAGLLDALAALGQPPEAIVLVGAQAVYEYSSSLDAEISVAPYTYDADLVLIPDLLADEPLIGDAMSSVGFMPADQPGIYRRDDNAQVDLLVPEKIGGRRGRGADLGPHGPRKAARQARGLEGALVSHTMRTIDSLNDHDQRFFDIHVAGPGALLVAKVHKLADRSAVPDNPRLQTKDAFDVYRLLRCADTMELAREIERLLDDELSQDVTGEALQKFAELFGTVTAAGTKMVVDHARDLMDLDFLAQSAVLLAQDLMEEVADRSC